MKSNWRASLQWKFNATILCCATAIGGCAPQPVVHETATAVDNVDTDAAGETALPHSGEGPTSNAIGRDAGQRKVDVQVGGPGGVNVQVGPSANNTEPTIDR